MNYNLLYCKDCGLDFLTPKGRYCPLCGDNINVEFIRRIWFDRKFKTSNKRWTKDDLETLVLMYKNNYSYSDIAKELNRTYNAISRKLQRLRKNKKYRKELTRE